MKKYNVYTELLYLIISIPLGVIGIGLIIGAIILSGYVIMFMAAAIFMFFFIVFLIFGLPNTLNYLGCKKSNEIIKAKVVDKFQRNYKIKRKEERFLIVLEYKIDDVSYRSVNLVSKEKNENINIKDKVDVRIYKNKALLV